MELASMLAGEHFSDHPRAVHPVLAAFMREYNDRVGDERRQDLYALASAVVGTRRRSGFGRRCRSAVRGALRESTGHRALGAYDAALELARAYATDGERGHRKALRLLRELAGEMPPLPPGGVDRRRTTAVRR